MQGAGSFVVVRSDTSVSLIRSSWLEWSIHTYESDGSVTRYDQNTSRKFRSECCDKGISKSDEEYFLSVIPSFHDSGEGITLLTDGVRQASGTCYLVYKHWSPRVLVTWYTRIDPLNEGLSKAFQYYFCVQSSCLILWIMITHTHLYVVFFLYDHWNASNSTKVNFVENEEYFFWGNTYNWMGILPATGNPFPTGIPFPASKSHATVGHFWTEHLAPATGNPFSTGIPFPAIKSHCNSASFPDGKFGHGYRESFVYRESFPCN
jgi:hypothetical protein